MYARLLCTCHFGFSQWFEMNGIQLNGKTRSSEKPVPGYLGRMVNLFDLTSTISRNRLLSDKPYIDGSSLSRSRSDVSRISIIGVDEMENTMAVSELRKSSSNRKPSGTPVKMLIAHEMSKDLEPKQKSPNVVAKLMGLDVLPEKDSDFLTRRIQTRLYSQNRHSEIPIGYWQDEHGFISKKVDCEVHSHVNQNEYKDIYEILRHSHSTNCERDKSPAKGRSNDNFNDKKLALIRKKFMEAKRLATDDKLRQTKEFQDALDILSSNGDIFLKALQEPKFLISQHLYLGESLSSSPETKRITVLKPAKMVSDDKVGAPVFDWNENQVRKQVSLNQVNVWENQRHRFSPTISSLKDGDSPIQPTRIVVLKPSPGKGIEPHAVVSSTSSSPRLLLFENFFEETVNEEARETREVPKVITQQMCENLAAYRRDETLLSSMLSNGHTGDDSSFEKSENEFVAEYFSKYEVISPASRHSWDCVNRYGSPFSSSFSHLSYSPESSVNREAKRRLFERWAMMASNGNNNNNSLDQQHFPRSSSTLGELLALSEVKKSEICDEEKNYEDQDSGDSTSGHNSNVDTRESGSEPPTNLRSSESVLVSSSAYGERNGQVTDAGVCNGEVSKEILKTKISKTSFTEKVTCLFSLWNKKSGKVKPSKSPPNNASQLATAEVGGLPAPSSRTSNEHSEVVLSPTSKSHGGMDLSNLNDTRLGQGICSPQQGASLIKGENQEQPSPISVLEPPFEEDDSSVHGCSRSILSNPHGEHIPFCFGKSNLIDKSPPSGRIVRTFSWDETFAESSNNYPSNSPFLSPRAEDDEGEEYLYLVQSLLTMADHNDNEEICSTLVRWHSLDRPLHPVIRAKYIDLSAKEPLPEAKRRHLRSNRKLVFDCVNAALVDITGFQTTLSSWGVDHNNRYMESEVGMALADKVWAWMKELLPGEFKYLSLDGGDSDNLVESYVRKDITGKGWIEQLKLQVESIGKEIERKLLEEIMECFVNWDC